MRDRKPVWLTDEERRIIGLCLIGAAQRSTTEDKAEVRWRLADRFAPDERPEPWLTVDDAGNVMRMEMHHKLDSSGARARLDSPEGAATPMYVAVPVEDGAPDA